MVAQVQLCSWAGERFWYDLGGGRQRLASTAMVLTLSWRFSKDFSIFQKRSPRMTARSREVGQEALKEKIFRRVIHQFGSKTEEGKSENPNDTLLLAHLLLRTKTSRSTATINDRNSIYGSNFGAKSRS